MRSLRRLAITAAGLALAVPLVLAFASPSGANSIESGSTILSTTGTVTNGTPYSSGQPIDITVSSNTTLSLTNLENNGYSGEPNIEIYECADPGGTSGNLPSSFNGYCDGQTLESTTDLNSNGSFTYNNYPIYSLPDVPTFNENPNGAPECGTGNNECVLIMGPDPQNFSDPHLFSGPFSVFSNSSDNGANPGDGTAAALTAQNVSFTSTAPSPAYVNGTYTPSATGGASGRSVLISIGSTSTAGTCSYSGGEVHFAAAGTCVVDANQAGNQNYAAGSAAQSIPVDLNPQAITFTSSPPNPSVIDGPSYTPTANGGASSNPVVFSIDSGSTSGACSYSGSTGEVSFTGPGTCIIDANQAGNSVYAPAPTKDQTVDLSQTEQTITFTSSPPADGTIGGTYTPTANGGASGNPVVFSLDASSTSGACSIASGVVSFKGNGTCIIDANQAGNSAYVAATQVSQKVYSGFVITTTSLPTATEGTPYDAQLVAVGATPGKVKWAFAGGQTLPKGLKVKNGEVSGTVKLGKKAPPAGTFKFTVKATDKKTKTTPAQTVDSVTLTLTLDS